jgi:hypothetical protein
MEKIIVDNLPASGPLFCVICLISFTPPNTSQRKLLKIIFFSPPPPTMLGITSRVPGIILIFIFYLFTFLVGLGFDVCKAGTLPLEPYLQFILFCLFWRWGSHK